MIGFRDSGIEIRVGSHDGVWGRGRRWGLMGLYIEFCMMITYFLEKRGKVRAVFSNDLYVKVCQPIPKGSQHAPFDKELKNRRFFMYFFVAVNQSLFIEIRICKSKKTCKTVNKQRNR